MPEAAAVDLDTDREVLALCLRRVGLDAQAGRVSVRANHGVAIAGGILASHHKRNEGRVVACHKVLEEDDAVRTA